MKIVVCEHLGLFCFRQDQAKLDDLQSQLSKEKAFKRLKVPVLVTTCAEEIERRGLKEEGIYRTSGTTTAITFLKNQFDEGIHYHVIDSLHGCFEACILSL